jgi:hypothetical protein
VLECEIIATCMCCMMQDLARNMGLQKDGLRSLAAATLRQRLRKEDQCSNWQSLELTDTCGALSVSPCCHACGLIPCSVVLEDGFEDNPLTHKEGGTRTPINIRLRVVACSANQSQL